jgi:hypothetical protein
MNKPETMKITNSIYEENISASVLFTFTSKLEYILDMLKIYFK